MTKFSFASSPMISNAPTGQLIDPYLLPFVLATDEAKADELLIALIDSHALPIITRVVGRERDAEDLRSEILTKVVALLRECKAAPTLNPIANFSHYVAVLSSNICRAEQRRLHPQRRSLKDALRHALTHDRQFALWLSPTQEQVCGLRDWLNQPPRQSEKLQQVLRHPQLLDDLVEGDWRRIKRNELLQTLFHWVGHPFRFDDLVEILAILQGVKDGPPVTPFLTDDHTVVDPLAHLAAPGAQPDEDVAWRAFLATLWYEVEQLPPLQRIAYLLNFTDGEIELFWFYGIASIRQIGKVVQLTNEQFNRVWVLLEWNEMQRACAQSLTNDDEKFAMLWQHLPLNDLTIASLLETSRQNVINLRQAARKRLSRKISSTIAISTPPSRQ